MNPSTHLPLIGIPAATLQQPALPGVSDYQFNGNYPLALVASGALPVVIPLDLPENALRAIYERLDGLCLAGGDDVDPGHYWEMPHPALKKVDALRDRVELTLARWAVAADLPVLGICRGIQLLNVAAGGSLYQDVGTQLPGKVRHDQELSEVPWEHPAHRVRVAEGSALAGILGTCDLTTNSFHHQAVKRPAAGFEPAAWAEDGLIEGIENRSRRFAVAVQWHPEGVYRSDPYAARLFSAFVEAARDGR